MTIAMDDRPDLLGLEPEPLEEALRLHFEERGQPPFRANMSPLRVQVGFEVLPHGLPRRSGITQAPFRSIVGMGFFFSSVS